MEFLENCMMSGTVNVKSIVCGILLYNSEHTRPSLHACCSQHHSASLLTL